ncbi:MAG: ABC transporter permease subunit [Planctomycetota bacterium]
MRTYVIKRLLLMIPTLFGVSLVVWVILTCAPEPPIAAQAPGAEGKSTGDAGGLSQSVKVFRAQYGLDRPAVLNPYYKLTAEEVRKKLLDANDRAAEVKVRSDAQEQLIRWGYYAVPALHSFVAGTDVALRDTAMSWLVKSAQRVAVGAETGRLDPETSRRNAEIVIENEILDLYRWNAGDSEVRKQAGVLAFRAWFHGSQDQFPAVTPAEQDRIAQELDQPPLPEAAGARSDVSALVAIALADETRRERALERLASSLTASLTVDPASDPVAAEFRRLHQTAFERIRWQASDPPSRQQAGMQLLEDWWFGSAQRWDYSGSGWARVLFLETRFAQYWGNLLRLDLGYSTQYKMPVVTLILEKLKYSLTLSVTSLLLAYLVAVPLGMLSARIHGSWAERALSLFVFGLYSLPSFFVATLLVRYLAKGQPGSFEWIPDGGFADINAWRLSTTAYVKDVAWHVVAPIICMTYGSFAALSRYAKSGLMNVLRSDYVRTARAKGLSEFTVTVKHAGRNGIIPVITLLGTTLPTIVGGAFIIEWIFSIPGFGLLTVNSIFQRDLNVIIGITLLVAVLTMIGILLSDLLYAVVDPRISFS